MQKPWEAKAGQDGYNPKSCNALEKPYYSPIEAAIRWCGLIEHEASILASMAHHGVHIPLPGQFPSWPCLRLNVEKILDAFEHGLQHGRDGKPVQKGEHVASYRRTVRHADLKEWMAKHYPDQKPAFLFDEVERNTHAVIDVQTFTALHAKLTALEAERERVLALSREIMAERDRLLGERDTLRAMVEKMGAPGEKAETTFLNIIGGLLGLMLGETPSGKPQSVFANQSAIISALLAHYGDKPGISDRTLEGKFAAANRSLKST